MADRRAHAPISNKHQQLQ